MIRPSSPVILLALLALSPLAGCGAASESAPAAQSAPSAEAPAAAAASAAAPPAAPSTPAARRSDIDVAALKAAVDTDSVGTFIDVRTPPEYGAGHAPGAVNIPLHELAGRLAEVGEPGQGTVYVICQSGGRSSKATDLLVRQGYTAANIVGGTAAWIAAGYPTE